MDIRTNYLGMELDNPVVVGASPLTYDLQGIKRCAKAGAGAVVLRSLFEEQIREEQAGLSDTLAQQTGLHDEVYQYIEAGLSMRYGTREYLAMLGKAKNEVEIPVIASINCISDEWWIDFAQEVEAAGADALELNAAILPKNMKDTAANIENRYLAIASHAKKAVSIPVSIKLGPYFTSLPEMLIKLHNLGIHGFVLFNRFYRPTIDIDTQKVVIGERFSAPGELSVTLRNIALYSGALPCDFVAASGVHKGEDVIRALLTGANAVQVVTTLLKHNVDYIGTMLADLRNWMDKSEYETLTDFRGNISQARNPDAKLFTRIQYIQALGGTIQSPENA